MNPVGRALMKLTILGSGTLIPFPNRGNSGYFLQTEKHTILIDGGSGALRRIADYHLDYKNIDTICYTHLHPDHIIDFIPLLFAYKHDPSVEIPKSLKIIAPKGFQTYFNQIMDIYGKWVLPDVGLNIEIEEVFRDEIDLEGLEIICNHTEHTDYSVTYRFTENSGNSLFYSGDTDYCEELVQSAKNVDVLMLECSFPDEQKRPGHLTPSECGKIATETKCGRLILTHFYPEVLEIDILSTVSKYYSGMVDLAYDGMEVFIDA